MPEHRAFIVCRLDTSPPRWLSLDYEFPTWATTYPLAHRYGSRDEANRAIKYYEFPFVCRIIEHVFIDPEYEEGCVNSESNRV